MLIIHLNQRRMLNPKWRVLSLPARGLSLTGACAISGEKKKGEKNGKKRREKRCFHPADLKCGVFKLKEHEKEKKKNIHLVLKVVNNKCGYGEGHLFFKKKRENGAGKVARQLASALCPSCGDTWLSHHQTARQASHSSA